MDLIKLLIELIAYPQRNEMKQTVKKFCNKEKEEEEEAKNA